jgi:hypothetical protein
LYGYGISISPGGRTLYAAGSATDYEARYIRGALLRLIRRPR